MGKYSHISYALLHRVDALQDYLSMNQDDKLAASIMLSSQYTWLLDEIKVAASRATLSITRELTGSKVKVVRDGTIMFRGTVRGPGDSELRILISDGVTMVIDLEEVSHIREPDYVAGPHEIVLRVR